MSNTTPANKKIIMQTNALKSQKTNGGLGDFYVDDWEKGEKLQWVSCIWYLVTFKDQTEALLNSRNEVNAISQAFAY